MLVLTRKKEEKIVIGDKNPIIITILKIQGGDKVSIGIEADPDTPIYRWEIYEKNRAAPSDIAEKYQMEIPTYIPSPKN